MVRKYTVRSLEELRHLAVSLAVRLESGDVVLLQGELGSGKTTFTHYLAQALGVTQPMTSPTFTIATEYAIMHHSSLHKLIHVDLYRLSVDNASQDPAVRELLETAHALGIVTIIEWADRMSAEALAKVDRGWRLQFAHGSSENERHISIEHISL